MDLLNIVPRQHKLRQDLALSNQDVGRLTHCLSVRKRGCLHRQIDRVDHRHLRGATLDSLLNWRKLLAIEWTVLNGAWLQQGRVQEQLIVVLDLLAELLESHLEATWTC